MCEKVGRIVRVEKLSLSKKDLYRLWEIRNQIHRMPPIVLLSACDTLPATGLRTAAMAGFLEYPIWRVLELSSHPNIKCAGFTKVGS